jgi:zinc-ribbon domain
MFCPDCGAENSKGQKFCKRCGTNLMAIDRAREIVTEMTATTPAPEVSSRTILRIVGLIGTFGFLATTIGTAILRSFDSGFTPIPTFFALGGFTALVLICRYLLNMINPSAKAEPRHSSRQSSYAPPEVMRGATNRALNEPSHSYQSIIEEPTQHFEDERRIK